MATDPMEAYRRGAAELLAAVAAVGDIDARRSPAEWSTRMIVHHLADGEALWMQPLKLALLQDGFPYTHAWVQDGSAEALAYESRDMQLSMDLFCSQRAHAVALIDVVPDAIGRHVMLSMDGQERRVTVKDILYATNAHLAAHIAEVRENATG